MLVTIGAWIMFCIFTQSDCGLVFYVLTVCMKSCIYYVVIFHTIRLWSDDLYAVQYSTVWQCDHTKSRRLNFYDTCLWNCHYMNLRYMNLMMQCRVANCLDNNFNLSFLIHFVSNLHWLYIDTLYCEFCDCISKCICLSENIQSPHRDTVWWHSVQLECLKRG